MQMICFAGCAWECCRYSAVGFLDTDLGQTEFTAPGVVSLHLLRHPVLGEGGRGGVLRL